MKKRTARKVFKRLSRDYSAVRRYKMTTVATALTTVVGIECRPKDSFVVCGLAHLMATGALDPSFNKVTWSLHRDKQNHQRCRRQ